MRLIRNVSWSPRFWQLVGIEAWCSVCHHYLASEAINLTTRVDRWNTIVWADTGFKRLLWDFRVLPAIITLLEEFSDWGFSFEWTLGLTKVIDISGNWVELAHRVVTLAIFRDIVSFKKFWIDKTLKSRDEEICTFSITKWWICLQFDNSWLQNGCFCYLFMFSNTDVESLLRLCIGLLWVWYTRCVWLWHVDLVVCYLLLDLKLQSFYMPLIMRTLRLFELSMNSNSNTSFKHNWVQNY